MRYITKLFVKQYQNINNANRAKQIQIKLFCVSWSVYLSFFLLLRQVSSTIRWWRINWTRRANLHEYNVHVTAWKVLQIQYGWLTDFNKNVLHSKMENMKSLKIKTRMHSSRMRDRPALYRKRGVSLTESPRGQRTPLWTENPHHQTKTPPHPQSDKEWHHREPSPPEWNTGVKTLPCPKLRLRAVIIKRVFNWHHPHLTTCANDANLIDWNFGY